MARSISMFLGGMIAVGLMIVALYAWFNAADQARGSIEHADELRMAAKCLAIAAAAGAQMIALWLVVGRLYENRALNSTLRMIAASVCCIAIVAAAALGWAARG